MLEAQILADQGLTEEAVAVLNHALAIIPGFLRARMTLAQLQRQAGDIGAAVSSYRHVISSPQETTLALQLKRRATLEPTTIARELEKTQVTDDTVRSVAHQ